MSIEEIKQVAEENKGFFATWSNEKMLEVLAEVEQSYQLLKSLRQILKVCDACFTSSWQPCPPLTPNCIEDNTEGWMVCGYCRLVVRVEELSEEIETLGG